MITVVKSVKIGDMTVQLLKDDSGPLLNTIRIQAPSGYEDGQARMTTSVIDAGVAYDVVKALNLILDIR